MRFSSISFFILANYSLIANVREHAKTLSLGFLTDPAGLNHFLCFWWPKLNHARSKHAAASLINETNMTKPEALAMPCPTWWSRTVDYRNESFMFILRSERTEKCFHRQPPSHCSLLPVTAHKAKGTVLGLCTSMRVCYWQGGSEGLKACNSERFSPRWIPRVSS